MALKFFDVFLMKGPGECQLNVAEQFFDLLLYFAAKLFKNIESCLLNISPFYFMFFSALR